MTFRQSGGLACHRARDRDREPRQQAQHRDDLEHRGDPERARDQATERRSDDLALGLGARNALERIAYFVFLLTRRLGPRDENARSEPFDIELPLRRDDMADALGITAVHTSRGLSKLKQMGVLEFNRGSFRILDVAQLREIAGI